MGCVKGGLGCLGVYLRGGGWVWDSNAAPSLSVGCRGWWVGWHPMPSLTISGYQRHIPGPSSWHQHILLVCHQ